MDLRPIVSFLLLVVALAPARAQDSLVVGTKEAPPFAMRSEDGSWTGIGIELWKRAAAENGWTYDFVERTLPELIDGVQAGSLDAAVAAITVTTEREERVDFTQPFHASGLGIAVPVDTEMSLLQAARRFPVLAFLRVLGGLFVTLLVAGWLVWLFERKRNAEQFGGGARGLMSGLWFSAVTMTTVGYGDKAPRTLGGRTVALVWMFISLFMIATFTATMASTLTAAQFSARVNGPEDLPHARVAAVASSTGESYLRQRGIRVQSAPSARAALELLTNGNVDAVVHDAPILRYLVKETMPGQAAVLAKIFAKQNYAIALPERSPLLEQLNREVLRITSADDWQVVLDLYLGP